MKKETTIIESTGLVQKTELVTKKQTPINLFAIELNIMKPQIEKALPSGAKIERIMRVCLSAFSMNERLQKCSFISIISGIIQASQMGLEINTTMGEAYLIPRMNFGVLEAQFQLGYKGQMTLAYRSEKYKMIGCYKVYREEIEGVDGALFKYEYGLNQKCIHIPCLNPIGDPVAYYAMYETINGGKNFVVMSRDQTMAHAKKYSQSFKNEKSRAKSPWTTDPDAMGMKTTLKELMKYAPKSIEHAKFFSQDGTIKKEIDSDMSIVPNDFDFEGE